MSDDPQAAARRFVAGIVHELNNALTAIIGLAARLENAPGLDASVREQVHVIAENGRRVRQLSERLNAFSRGIDEPTPADRPRRTEPPTAPAPSGGGRSPNRGSSLLLVDDEEVIRRILTWQLEGMGHEVLAVGSAEGALAAYDSEPERFRLALVDIVLPGRSGLDLLRDLRRRRSDLPIILLTGAPLPDQSDTGGVCLTKPVSLQDLQRAVESALESSRRAI